MIQARIYTDKYIPIECWLKNMLASSNMIHVTSDESLRKPRILRILPTSLIAKHIYDEIKST